MAWRWLEVFRRERRVAHRASFELGQAAAAEEHAVEILEDLAKIGKRKLDVLSRVVEESRKFDDGDELMAEALKAYREGMAAMVATSSAASPTDREARRVAIEGPTSSDSTGSPTPSGGGLAGPSMKTPPDEGAGPSPHDEAPSSPEGREAEPPRRGRGRPKGARNKPKPGSQPTPGDPPDDR